MESLYYIKLKIYSSLNFWYIYYWYILLILICVYIVIFEFFLSQLIILNISDTVG